MTETSLFRFICSPRSEYCCFLEVGTLVGCCVGVACATFSEDFGFCDCTGFVSADFWVQLVIVRVEIVSNKKAAVDVLI